MTTEPTPDHALHARAERGQPRGADAVLGAARADADIGTLIAPEAHSTSHRWAITSAAVLLVAAAVGGAVVLSRSTGPTTTNQGAGGTPCADLLVYLEPDGSDAVRQAIEAELVTASNVASVVYLDHDAMYARFKDLFREEPAILENVQPRDLPPALQVEAADASTEHPLRALETEMRRHDGVFEVREIPVGLRCTPDAFSRVTDAAGNDHAGATATTAPGPD